MRSALIFTLLILINISTAFGQDQIITRQGGEITANILEITNSDLKYLKNDSTFTKPLADIFLVKFANGTKRVFGPEKAAVEPAPTHQQAKQFYDDSLFVRGKKEAEKYYRGNTGLNTLTLITTFLAPPVGLTSAIITTAIPPSRRQLRLPDVTLYAKPAYARGYQKKAGQIKAAKVWKNFGIGCAFFGFAYFSISRYR